MCSRASSSSWVAPRTARTATSWSSPRSARRDAELCGKASPAGAAARARVRSRVRCAGGGRSGWPTWAGGRVRRPAATAEGEPAAGASSACTPQSPPGPGPVAGVGAAHAVVPAAARRAGATGAAGATEGGGFAGGSAASPKAAASPRRRGRGLRQAVRSRPGRVPSRPGRGVGAGRRQLAERGDGAARLAGYRGGEVAERVRCRRWREGGSWRRQRSAGGADRRLGPQ